MTLKKSTRALLSLIPLLSSVRTCKSNSLCVYSCQYACSYMIISSHLLHQDVEQTLWWRHPLVDAVGKMLSSPGRKNEYQYISNFINILHCTISYIHRLSSLCTSPQSQCYWSPLPQHIVCSEQKRRRTVSYHLRWWRQSPRRWAVAPRWRGMDRDGSPVPMHAYRGCEWLHGLHEYV